jgi:hypothetical protein
MKVFKPSPCGLDQVDLDSKSASSYLMTECQSVCLSFLVSCHYLRPIMNFFFLFLYIGMGLLWDAIPD